MSGVTQGPSPADGQGQSSLCQLPQEILDIIDRFTFADRAMSDISLLKDWATRRSICRLLRSSVDKATKFRLHVIQTAERTWVLGPSNESTKQITIINFTNERTNLSPSVLQALERAIGSGKVESITADYIPKNEHRVAPDVMQPIDMDYPMLKKLGCNTPLFQTSRPTHKQPDHGYFIYTVPQRHDEACDIDCGTVEGDSGSHSFVGLCGSPREESFDYAAESVTSVLYHSAPGGLCTWVDVETFGPSGWTVRGDLFSEYQKLTSTQRDALEGVAIRLSRLPDTDYMDSEDGGQDTIHQRVSWMSGSEFAESPEGKAALALMVKRRLTPF